MSDLLCYLSSYAAFGIRSIGAFKVASSCDTGEVCFNLIRSKLMSLREVKVDQRRGPKPACPESARHTEDITDRTVCRNSYVTDEIFCMSLLRFEPTTF